MDGSTMPRRARQPRNGSGSVMGTARLATTPRQRSDIAMRTPDVEPLARASTLPSTYYLDPAVLELERSRIFGRTWQLVAHWDDLSREGDFVPVTVLDEPVVITHG